MEIDTHGYLNRLQSKMKSKHDFPSEEHEIAWDIAVYFNEPYGFWVRKMKNRKRYLGEIRAELDNLRTRKLGRKDKVRVFMAWL